LHATNEKSRHGVQGPPFFFLVRGREWSGVEWREGFCFQGVIGEEEWTVHSSLFIWTANSRLSMQAFFSVFWWAGERAGVGRLKQRLPKFLTCFPKSSQWHLTFIPYALANVVVLSHV
jgi:hypothetical protein